MPRECEHCFESSGLARFDEGRSWYEVICFYCGWRAYYMALSGLRCDPEPYRVQGREPHRNVASR